MDYKELISLALSSLKGNILRTLLTMLGIIIGIAAIVSLQSLGAGFERSISADFDSLDADTIVMSKTIN